MTRRILLVALTAGTTLGITGCQAESGRPVSRSEMAGIVRPAGKRPAGVAKLEVQTEQGTTQVVLVDRGQFWEQTGVVLPQDR